MKGRDLTLNNKGRIIDLFSVIENYLNLSDKGEFQIVKVPFDTLNKLNINSGEARSLIQFVNKNIGSINCWINILNGDLEFTENQTLVISEENISPVDNLYKGDEKDFLILEIINWKIYKKNILSFLEINKFKPSSNIMEKIENAKNIFIINEERKEIFRKDKKKFKYTFRKSNKNKRFEYLIKIYHNPKVSGYDLAGVGKLQNLSKELRTINDTLKNKLKLSEDFILNDNNTGYQVNDKYYIEFE